MGHITVDQQSLVSGTECPFCGSQEATVLRTVSAQDAATHSVRPNFDPVLHKELSEAIARLWRSDHCSVMRCRRCDGVFSWPFAGGDSAFYNLTHSRAIGYPQFRWEFDVAVRWMRGSATGGKRKMLELGAGDGAFLRRLLGAGIPPGVLWAVEYSERARQALSRIDTRIHVVPSVQDLPAFSSAKRGAFTHVFAFQVMEHVSQALEYFNAFARVLAADGVLCLSVPNPARIEFNERSGLLLDMPPYHVSRLGPAAMSALSNRAGFYIEHTETEPFDFVSSLKEFLSYHYKRRVQAIGGLQNWMERYLPRRLAALMGALVALPSAGSLMLHRNDGGSLFYALRKRSRA